MIYGVPLLDVRTIFIPYIGLKGPGISKIALYLSGEGDGSRVQ